MTEGNLSDGFPVSQFDIVHLGNGVAELLTGSLGV